MAGVNLICALTEWRVRFLFFLLTILGFYLVGVGAVDDPLLSRGEHCSPVKNHKVTFLLLALLSDQKRGKSHLRGFYILLKITFRVHELVARAMRGECVRHRSNVKVGGFIALRNLNHTTRANISREKAEQIRARIVCTPAINAGRAWVE